MVAILAHPQEISRQGRMKCCLSRFKYHYCAISSVESQEAQFASFIIHFSQAAKPLPSCTQYHQKSLGLPCNHIIKDLIDSGQSLLPSHFDQQHWLILPDRVIQTNRQQIRRIGRVRINEPAQLKGVGPPKLLETVKRWQLWGGEASYRSEIWGKAKPRYLRFYG